jgi:energy-coupling factor transporter transmembrane protein EcfT
METNEMVIAIIVFFVGLFAAVAKNVNPYPKSLLVATLLAVVVQATKGTLLSLVFFFSFLPILFLQKNLSTRTKVKESSSVLEKFLAYFGMLPLFGIAFVFREDLKELMISWSFDAENLILVELAFLVFTIYWSVEWSKKQRRER